MFQQVWHAMFGFIIVLLLSVSTHAQQYVGAAVANSYPVIPGSIITYFNVLDPNKKNATLVNYVSLNSTGGILPPANVKRLVIIIHGADRDPGTYMSNGLSALGVANTPGVGFDNVQILAPAFPNGDDKGAAYPYITGQGTNSSYSACLVWQGSGWAGGYGNQYPVNRRNISSYAVLDQIITYYSNKTLFPNINQIVVAGHSLGGQTVQRYAAIGNVLSTSVPISYWIGNPNAWLWFSSTYPLSTSSCSIADNWFNGFSNFTGSGMLYGSSLVASGRSAALSLYNSRNLRYARGTNDTGDDSSTCAPFAQGENRNERFFAFIEQFPPSSTTTIDYMACGHDFPCMSQSQPGLDRLFLDNFNGTGATAYDQGCPRLQAGDDPYPNPSCGVTKPVVDAGTYSGYKYMGCYTDQYPATLAYVAYRGNTSNSISGCIQTCQAAGYSIAGTEYGDECYCDNNMSYAAEGPLVEPACGMACPSNSSAICGDSYRLSIFARGNTTREVVPVAPATVGNYSYLGCYTEATSGRALSSSSLTSSSSMTIEMCASFCSSYHYFGVEYSTQCFCGNSLNAGSVNTTGSGCTMTCNGNTTELCGGPNYLNMYYSNATGLSTASSSTATSVTTSATSVTSTTFASATLSCPGSNGTTYTANGKGYVVMCSTDYNGGDLSSTSASTIEACITACANTTGCIALAYLPGACYMKSTLNAGVTSSNVVGAALNSTLAGQSSSSSSSTVSSTTSLSSSATSVMTTSSQSFSSFTNSSSAASTTTSSLASATSSSSKTTSSITQSSSTSTNSIISSSSTPVTTSTTASSASSTTSSAASSTVSVSCPASNTTTYTSPNGNNFKIACSIDYNGGDLSSVTSSSFAACLNSCSTTSSCVAVAYVSSACYMKSTLLSGVSNSAVWGAALVGSSSTSSTVAITSTSTASASSSSVASAQTTSTTNTAVISMTSSSAQTSSSSIISSTSKTSVTSSSTTFSTTSSSLSPISSSSSSSPSTTSSVTSTSSSASNSSSTSATTFATSTKSTSSTGSFPTSSSTLASTSSSISASISSSTSTSSVTSSTKSASTSTSTSTSTSSNSTSISTSTSTSTSTTTTTTSTSTPPTCPSSNNTLYTPPSTSQTSTNQTYTIQCALDHNAGDFNMTYTSSFANCIATCATTWPCVAVSWIPGGNTGPCYMKSKVVAAVAAGSVWGAVWVGNGTGNGTTGS